MDIINPKLIWRIQQASAILVISFSIFAAVYAIIEQSSVFYASSFFVIIFLFIFTLIINHKSMQFLQVFLFLIIGTCTIWFGENTYFIGDIIMITGILLAYTYRLIKHYTYKSIPGIVLFIISIQLSAGIAIQRTIKTDTIVTTALASILIFFMLTQLNTKLTLYTRESCRKEAYIRLGINAGNLLHNLKIGTARNALYFIEKKIRENKAGEALVFTQGLKMWLDEKEFIRNQLVSAINLNLSEVRKHIGVEEIIDGILGLEKIDSKVLGIIDFKTDYYPGGIMIYAVPFEIYFIIQNIINNAVEAMKGFKGKRKHSLHIKTGKTRNRAVITITDTGGGFPVPGEGASGEIDPAKVKTGKNKETGYGLTYIVTLVKQNRGTVRFRNVVAGAEVTVAFPLAGGGQ
jgi:hypothetical protein